jgi:hypothetical protein
MTVYLITYDQEARFLLSPNFAAALQSIYASPQMEPPSMR